VLQRVDLEPVKEEFLSNPTDTGRDLMSRTWR